MRLTPEQIKQRIEMTTALSKVINEYVNSTIHRINPYSAEWSLGLAARIISEIDPDSVIVEEVQKGWTGNLRGIHKV